MKKLAALVRYTFVENVRQKIFFSLLIFAPVLFAASGILGAIGGEQKIRVLKDFGFFISEFAALFTAIILGSTFIYDEIENKSVYMIMSRPVRKHLYLAGRFLGFFLTTSALLAFMTALNALAVRLSGGTFSLQDACVAVLSAMKISTILALCVFFAMLTTSKSASMIFALFFWVLGHFTSELEFLGRLAASPVVKLLALASRFAVPRLDMFAPVDVAVGVRQAFSAGIYAVLYSAAALSAAYLIFRRKEF